jgi:putative addiction module component (TIGR02574 family)
MTDAARRLIAEVLALPEEERLALLGELVASLDSAHHPENNAEWTEELDRRVARADADGNAGEEWAAVRARLVDELHTK